MRNQLNELKPCEIHSGHFADYFITGFMKQMQCNATPSLNIIKTTAKQVWLSVRNIRRNYAASIRRHYHNSSDCFEYPKNLYLNQATPKKYFPTQKHPGIENFKPKKSFDHPRHLKSGVPPPPPRWDLLASEKPQHLETRPVY